MHHWLRGRMGRPLEASLRSVNYVTINKTKIKKSVDC